MVLQLPSTRWEGGRARNTGLYMVEEEKNLNQIGVIGEDSEATRVYDTTLARTIKNGGGMGAKTGLYMVENQRIAGWHENENVIAAHRDDEKRSTVSEEVYHKDTGILTTIQAAHIPKVIEGYPIILGNIYPSGSENGDVLDVGGISKTLKSGETDNPKSGGVGSCNSPKIIEPDKRPRVMESCIKDESEISPTITATNCSKNADNQPWISSKQRIRRLTPRECFRLQGFPDSFDISQVSDSQAYKQAGNSITTNVLREIFRKLLTP